jgi:hypothetical protein
MTLPVSTVEVEVVDELLLSISCATRVAEAPTTAIESAVASWKAVSLS